MDLYAQKLIKLVPDYGLAHSRAFVHSQIYTLTQSADTVMTLNKTSRMKTSRQTVSHPGWVAVFTHSRDNGLYTDIKRFTVGCFYNIIDGVVFLTRQLFFTRSVG